MPYHIAWQTSKAVLCLKLIDQVSMEEFTEINQQVNNYLDQIEDTDCVALMIDALNAQKVPQGLSQMRASQTYANRNNVSRILVVTDDKRIRLIMLLTFNLSRALLQFTDTYDFADRLLQQFSRSIISPREKL